MSLDVIDDGVRVRTRDSPEVVDRNAGVDDGAKVPHAYLCTFPWCASCHGILGADSAESRWAEECCSSTEHSEEHTQVPYTDDSVNTTNLRCRQ